MLLGLRTGRNPRTGIRRLSCKTDEEIHSKKCSTLSARTKEFCTLSTYNQKTPNIQLFTTMFGLNDTTVLIHSRETQQGTPPVLPSIIFASLRFAYIYKYRGHRVTSLTDVPLQWLF